MRKNKLLLGTLAGSLVLAGGIISPGLVVLAQAPASPAPSTAPSQESGRPILNFVRKHFQRAWELRSKLDLSDEQKARIRQTVAGHKAEILDAFKEVREKRQALREKVLAEMPSEQAIRDAADQLGKAIGDAAVKASQIAGEVRKNLTTEQLEKIRKFHEKQRAELDKALDKALGE